MNRMAHAARSPIVSVRFVCVVNHSRLACGSICGIHFPKITVTFFPTSRIVSKNIVRCVRSYSTILQRYFWELWYIQSPCSPAGPVIVNYLISTVDAMRVRYPSANFVLCGDLTNSTLRKQRLPISFVKQRISVGSVTPSWICMLSGWDTNSSPVGIWKMSALKLMRGVPGNLLHYIREQGAADFQIKEAVSRFFLALYNQRESTSLNVARYDIYRKRKPPQQWRHCLLQSVTFSSMGSVPIYRWCFGKQQTALTNQSEFEWNKSKGEKEGEGVIMPIFDISPVAPLAVLAMISCSCKAGLKPFLTAKCSCIAAGLACTSYCFWKGSDSACCNTFTHLQ